jgi:hypothetical protein
MNIPDFKITSQEKLSSLIIEKGIFDFHALCQYVENLPYTRISNKSDLSLTISENCGTCSSKHAFLKQVAIENEQDDIQLIVGIFKMNSVNTPVLSDILAAANLEYIPEAHCYLKYKNKRFDFTKPDIDVNTFKDDILIEKEITPEQVGEWKANFQRTFIERWLLDNEMDFSLDEIWEARERCIEAIVNE